ncbi:unnamed protein product [Cuscuta epithymum]|uniref:Voltage-dependent anion-selective channel protein n=2 Tax=Cuscuta epithymum TaxID=186058 RepID=A0AAV0FS92_9ASTE|nr:unnamed protein product [Cuscuta epithymum]
MSIGPGLYSSIGRKAKDLLTKDYVSDQKLSISTISDSGVALTSTAVKKGALSTGDVAAQYRYNNAIVDVKVDTESNISTTLTVANILPSTKAIASLKFPDYNSGKLEFEYFHHHATLAAAVSAPKQSPNVDLSVTFGTSTFAVGAEAGYETSSGKLTKYSAGISVTGPDSCAALILGDKGDSIKASYTHHPYASKKAAVVGEILRRFSTNENTITVGGSCAIDELTNVKLKLNNQGQLGAVLQHEVFPKSILSISSELDTKALEKTPRFGVALALKP